MLARYRLPPCKCGDLRHALVLPEGCGQWTQQERPDEVGAALIPFLEELRDRI
ncbi:hypothetical protein ACIRJM_19430 [Streptomyces sp. NPDC102405]|uniref:hypothetical protein n=1 Tax=Streptomyces sp. NPDC102405 TaxID=3366170 RepID=UPI003825071B